MLTGVLVENTRQGGFVSHGSHKQRELCGGTCYMHRQRMVCGVMGDAIILKLGQSEAERVIREGAGTVFDITGKAMKSWIMVPAARIAAPDDFPPPNH